MTTIYLIRHAEAEGNLYRRIHGDYNSLVTENGRVQIEALRRRFADVPVDAVWSSDRYRTMATAQSVCAPKGLPLHTDPDLREIDMGTWEDRPWGEKGYMEHDELARFDAMEPDWHAPGGESRVQVGARMMRAMRRIAQSCPDGTVAVFSHGTSIGHFVADARGLTPDQWKDKFVHADNTAVTCLAWDGTRFAVIYEGDNSHLGEDCSTLAKQNWWRAGNKVRDVNLWYRPLDWETEREIYFTAYEAAQLDSGRESAEESALRLLAQSPWAIALAMDRGTPVGVVTMDAALMDQGVGVIGLCCMLPEFCGRELGIQMVGQAVSYFRPKGVDRLRIVTPRSDRVCAFFRRHGFLPVEGTGYMEKYIGYNG